LLRYQRYRAIDTLEAEQVIRRTIQHYGGSKLKRAESAPMQRLETQWYDSLQRGAPDYSVYGDDEYIYDVVACFQVYSRRYLHDVQRRGLLDRLKTMSCIVDLGCGIGLTTAMLAQMYPSADIYGTNLPQTVQFDMAQSLGAEARFAITDDIAAIASPVDLIFASEYFEHILAPIDHLRDVLAQLAPRALLVANSFNTRSVGHFETYRVDGQNMESAKVSRAFNHALRVSGYRKEDTGLWNNRPAFWTRLTDYC
jgi:2-polyprenyl-3-methyl-5-hydroxy-6-metoxy-1,4-benzoquinol methylase